MKSAAMPTLRKSNQGNLWSYQLQWTYIVILDHESQKLGVREPARGRFLQRTSRVAARLESRSCFSVSASCGWFMRGKRSDRHPWLG